jgi:predicted RNase H-like HicB family nuclease/DNA-binding XRE family transcriptional regulator
MKYHFEIHKEDVGYWAECIELSGCITVGDSMAELKKNMEEALNLYIDEPGDSTKLHSLPDNNLSKSRHLAEVPVEPSIAFAFMVRYNRIKHGLTQQEAAQKLGFENLNSYQKLENKKCKPSLKIISELKKIFPEFSVDLALNC